MNILSGLIGLALAYTIIRYRSNLVDIIGKVSWAEKWLGSTYNMIVLIGVCIAIFSLLTVFGMQETVFSGLKNPQI